MKMHIECIPCLYQQALDASKIAGANKHQQKQILDECDRLIPKLLLNITSPEVAGSIYKIINSILKTDDPFREIKRSSNNMALDKYEILKKMVNKGKDRLLVAVELAIAGNIIDYGVMTYLDTEAEIKNLFSGGFKNNKKGKGVFDYPEFKDAVQKAKTILYLGDNAGETVFDRILIEELKNSGKEIYYAVKERPVINDAVLEDALESGIDKYASIISNGSDLPGTMLSTCSKEFIALFDRADLIISKGQANYETLNEINASIFFSFV